eukprot:scaffold15679_cov74-Skeletonema_dohrnii-CCMP3373.AAC.1
MQAPLQPDVVQHGQDPSPQQQPISVTMIPSSSAWERSEPQYASYCIEASVQPQFYTPSHSLDGFMSQVHHLQPSISPPYMQHQPVPVQDSFQYPSVYGVDALRTSAPYPVQQVQTQAQAFSYDRDSNQPSPQSQSDSDSDSSPRESESSAKSPPRCKGKCKGKELHVRHLPSDMSEEELRDLFSQHGVVTRASIARHQSGKSRGYAFLKFKLQSAADNAMMRLDKYEIRGKLLHLEYAMKQPRPRGRATTSEVECQIKTRRRCQGQGQGRVRRAASAPL